MKKAFYIISLVLIISSCKKNVDKAMSSPKDKILLDSVSKAKFIRETKTINYDSFYKEAKQYCRENNFKSGQIHSNRFRVAFWFKKIFHL